MESSPLFSQNWQVCSANRVWQECCSMTCESWSQMQPGSFPILPSATSCVRRWLSRGQNGEEVSRRFQLPAIWVTPSFLVFPLEILRHSGAEASTNSVMPKSLAYRPHERWNHCCRLPPNVRVICEARVANQSERWNYPNSVLGWYTAWPLRKWGKKLRLKYNERLLVC